MQTFWLQVVYASQFLPSKQEDVARVGTEENDPAADESEI